MPEPQARRGVCTTEAWSFGRLEEFWTLFEPLTPYGKDERDRRAVLGEAASIEALYDETEALLAFMGEADGACLDRISYHLRRIPRLPLETSGEAIELVELFQVKKFFANFKSLLALLPDRLKDRFHLVFGSEDLAARLDSGGCDPETFFLADAFHPGLPPVRSAIRDADAALAAAAREAESRARLERGLDFAGREFLVLPHEEARLLLGTRDSASVGESQAFAVEAYDGRSCIVRILPSEAVLLLEEEREALRDRERALEAEVLATLSAEVIAELPALASYVDSLCRFDLARARAVLAMDQGLTRPRLGPGTAAAPGLELKGGRFLPCAWECSRLSLAYAPLDLGLEEGAAVLFGSNMGGKTVALQSLVFFQVLAQAGFHVPAASYSTRVYSCIAYVGELKGEGRPSEGLSGFGFEIRAFVEAWNRARDGGAFLALDEFARTTSSREAEALLSAAIAGLLSLEGTMSLFSTHFRGVERIPGVRYLRMRGLDRRLACEGLLSREEVGERIRRINGMMRYEIADDPGGSAEGSDAIAISALLGLDASIVEAAESRYGNCGDL